MTTRYRCRLWKTGHRPPKPTVGATAAAWSGWYRARAPRVLVAAVVLEADASDDATLEAARRFPSADYVETEPIGPDPRPAA